MRASISRSSSKRKESQDMSRASAVIFDLGGTLLPCWDEQDNGERWASSYNDLVTILPDHPWPARDAFVMAMLDAEKAHWQRVVCEQWSGPPTGVLCEGFRRLDLAVDEEGIRIALDGYARALRGWTMVYPDTRSTLHQLSQQGYRIGLLSNTWWPAAWHNADLERHGLLDLFDSICYSSDLPYSKPHPSVFLEVARRLNVDPAACVHVGDRMVEDISGGLGAGMRAVWKKNAYPWPKPVGLVPTAVITTLAELPELLCSWGGTDEHLPASCKKKE